VTTVHPKPRLRVELPARELTLDDVTELAASSDLRYELVDGNLLVMAPADIDHMRVITKLLLWFDKHGTEHVLPTPGLRIHGRSSGRNPDLMVMRRGAAIPRVTCVKSSTNT
jgi:Uma2 family endonuclease